MNRTYKVRYIAGLARYALEEASEYWTEEPQEDAMPTIIARVDDTIGDTPIVFLRRLSAGLPATVAIKLESRNPGGSVKDRIGKGMVDDAEARGVLTPGKSVIIEPTSGNTGIALALIGASRGYRVILTMPESMSIERRKLLKAYGAELVLTPKEKGMKGAVEAASELATSTPDAWIAGQFDNPANPKAHYDTTGPEIEAALGDEKIGAFVAGVGTGGTITGAGRYLKERFPGTLAIAVEPAESPIISQRIAGEDLTPGPHLIQGIGANFIPTVLDLTPSSTLLVTTRTHSLAERPMKRDCWSASRAVPTLPPHCASPPDLNSPARWWSR